MPLQRQATTLTAVNLDLALRRAKRRLPQDANGQPYPALGLFASPSAVRTLGSDAFFYMLLIKELFWATLLAIFFSLPAMAFNMGMLTPAPNLTAEYQTYFERGLVTGVTEADVWTSNASWSERCPLGDGAPLLWGRPGGNAELLGAPYLSVVHVATDSLTLLVFLVYLCRLQRLSIKDDSIMAQIAGDTNRKKRAGRYGGKVYHAAGMIAGAVKRTTIVGVAHASLAASRLQAVARSRAARRQFRALSEARDEAQGRLGTASVGRKRAHTIAAVGIVTKTAAVKGWRGAQRRMRLKLPPVSAWWSSAAAAPARLDMVAKACSVVLWADSTGQWADGAPVPSAALTILADTAGTPAAVEQAKEVFELAEALRKLEAARAARDRLPPVAAEAAPKATPSEAARHAAQLSARHAAQARVDAFVHRVADLTARHGSTRGNGRPGPSSNAGGGSKLWRVAASKLTSRHGRLLPICFVTFLTSGAARAALRKPTVEALKAIGVRIGAAPRPTDVEWTHLHEKTNTARLMGYDALTVVLMVPIIGMAIIIATAFAQMCLFWVPMNCLFTGWCPAEKWLGGLSWVWGIVMFTLAYELLHQLTALPLGDGGFWPKNFAPSLKDWYHSRTMGQLRFVKVVGTVEMLVMFFCIGVLATAFMPGEAFSTRLCDATCLCWWLNPHLDSIGGWYDFGSGFPVNAIVNGLVGDAVLNSFAFRHLGGILTRRFLALREPTQHLMDEAVRARDPYYLSWRIVHLVKVWFFAIVLWPLVPLVGAPALAYYLVSYPIDRANMLALLEPQPPSSGLCMRFVLVCLLPAAIPIHLGVAFTGYVAKLRHPTSGRHVTLLEALEDPRLVFFVIFSLLAVSVLLFDMLVIQARRARRRGLLTPWEVVKAMVDDDTGFHISSRAEPFLRTDATLDDVPDATLRALYRPPFLAKGSTARGDATEDFLFQCAASDTAAATGLGQGGATPAQPPPPPKATPKGVKPRAVRFEQPSASADEAYGDIELAAAPASSALPRSSPSLTDATEADAPIESTADGLAAGGLAADDPAVAGLAAEGLAGDGLAGDGLGADGLGADGAVPWQLEREGKAMSLDEMLAGSDESSGEETSPADDAPAPAVGESSDSGSTAASLLLSTGAIRSDERV